MDFPASFGHRNGLRKIGLSNQEAGGRKVTEKPPKAEAKADAKAERETWMACARRKSGIHQASPELMITDGSLNGENDNQE